MRCVITGASGHLGSFLVELLVQQGHEVFAMIRPTSNLWRLKDVLNRISIIHGDLENLPQAKQSIMSAAPEVVFHLAWSGVTAESRDNPRQVTHNVTGTLELCDAALAAGCKTWIGIGSQAEYGPLDVILREDLVAKPQSAYGVSKFCSALLTEKMCALAGIRFAWARLLATYGPKDDERHLIPSVTRQLLAGRLPPLTLGEQIWDYLYVEDAVEAIYRLAVTPQASGVFNLGSGQAVTVRSIIEQIRDRIDPSLQLGFGSLPYRPNQPMFLMADISRLTSATGWKPATCLSSGLDRTVHWYRTQALSSQERPGPL